MTNSPEPTWPFISLDFAPSPTQDGEFIKQLPFIPGLKELLTIRQVHALEHATVWVLDEMATNENPRSDDQSLGGLSTEEGFYLYGSVNTAQLESAAHRALSRLTNGGEWDLAIHPRCGTNLSVAMGLTAGLAMGINLLLPKGFIIQLMGLGLAATAAAQLAPDLGKIAQKYLTTAIPFNIEIVDVTATKDFWGRPTHFVRVRWLS